MGTGHAQRQTKSRSAVCIALGISILCTAVQPDLAYAAAVFAPAISPEAERRIKIAQSDYDSGNFLAAARAWSEIGKDIPEKSEARDLRKGLYESIARAYNKAAINGAEEKILREAVGILNAYCQSFELAYPGAAVSVKVVRSRDEIKALLAEREPEPKPEPIPVPPQSPPVGPKHDTSSGDNRMSGQRGDDNAQGSAVTDVRSSDPSPLPSLRPWRGLAIAGGVSLGAGAIMSTLLAVGAARARSLEDQYNRMCSLDGSSDACLELDQQGFVANRLQLASLIGAPLFVGAGIALLAVAGKRRSKQRQVAVPLLSPGTVGLIWALRF